MATTDRRTVATAPSLTTSKPAPDPFYNVTKYGAIGDGATNSTEAIQAAIDDAAPSGGIVYLPGQIYMTTGLVLPGRVTLMGAGPSATTIMMMPNTTGSVIVTKDFSADFNSNAPVGPFGFAIRDIGIDGNRLNGGNGDGIVIYGYGYTLSNVRVRYCALDGIASYWSNASIPPQDFRFAESDGDGWEAHFENVKVHNNGRNGISWGGPHDSTWINVTASRNGQTVANSSGFYVEETNGGGHGGYLKCYGCHSYGNSQAFAWYMNAPVFCTDCFADGAHTYQVVISQNDCQWQGGAVIANGGGTVGFLLGVSVPVIGVNLRTKVENCTSGAIVFNNDGGGNTIDLNIYQTSGSISSGSPNSYRNQGNAQVSGMVNASGFDYAGDGTIYGDLELVQNPVSGSTGALSLQGHYINYELDGISLRSVLNAGMVVMDSAGSSYRSIGALNMIVNNNSGATMFFAADPGNTTAAGGLKIAGSAPFEIQARNGADSAFIGMAATAFRVTSARALKTNLRDLANEDILALINQTQAIRFNMKKSELVTEQDGSRHLEIYDELEDGKEKIGFIAEDLANVFPESVYMFEDDPTIAPGIDYGSLTPILFEAVKQLLTKIEDLEARIPPTDPVSQ